MVGGHEQKAHGLYARRKLTLTEKETHRTWRLVVKDVMDDATAYVNGRQVGRVRGNHTPLVCDITAAVHPGENEILLVVRDALANMDPAYVNPHDPVVSYQYLDVPGQGYAFAFAVNHTRLLSSPLVAAEDLQVQTSVREHRITARFNVANRTAAARSLLVKGSVLDAGRPVMDLGEARPVDLAPGESKPLVLAAPWADPVLWGPGSPKLYTLSVDVTDAASGRRCDQLRERFGFRECWIEHGRIMLNGAPVRLKGSNCGGGGGILPGDQVQWTRGSDGAEDFLDEFGCLAGYYTLGGLGNTPSRHNVERDIFWQIETQNVLAGAAQYVNHPCLIAWDLSNEWLSFLSYGGGDPLFGARRFKAVGDALLAYDPSRWILYDGDGDLHGLWDTLAEHYMIPYKGEQHSSYLPDSRFWRDLDHDLVPSEARSGYNKQMVYRSDLKAIMNTENAWKVDGLQPPGLSVVVGEDDVLSPAIDSGRGAIVWYWKQNVDGHRDLGASIVCNYTTITGLNRRAHNLQCFIMPEHIHHGFAGRPFQARYSLHNDLLVPSAYDFRWSLVDKSGTVVASGHDPQQMQSGGMQRGLVAFDLPQVTERTTYTLRLDLVADGKFAYGEERDIDVWPWEWRDVSPLFRKSGVRKVLLYDPAGRTAAVFTKAGIPFTPIDKLAVPESPPAETVIVLGEEAVQPNMASALALNDFVAAGGRIVALRQANLLPGVPVQTTLEKREWCSILFPRTPQHPVLKGTDSWDLSFWAPDHVGAKGSYSRPDSGSFVALVDGCSDHDRAGRSATEWVQLLECYRGQGLYLLCQLPLAEKFDQEPMARKLLARLMLYAASQPAFRQPTRTLELVGDPAGAVAAKLRDMGVAFRTIEPGATLDAHSIVLVDAASLPAGFTPPPAWTKALAAGATILVHGAAPGQQSLLAVLAGHPVKLTVQPYATWEGRGYRKGFTWLTPGLSHVDLYWKQFAGDEGAIWQAELPKYKIEDLCYWSVSSSGAVEHVFPGALVEIPVGEGRLIVDQIRWETATQKLLLPSRRVVSALIAGLGVAVAPYVPARDLPPNIVYKPVDLSLFCNRGFKDDVGDDGKGGWSDQGPNADLREFPTVSQNFGGVPFAVGQEPNCCVVLRSSQRPFPEWMPAEVTIPVGFPVEGLCFLHSVTWSGEGQHAGVYQVQYADGTSQEINLVSGENIRDWTAPPAEFPRERGTRSRVAWTGTTKLFPIVCVFQMLWVNPKPEVVVKAVRFSNPQKAACPILISLTAALKPGKADLEAIAAAQAKARRWLQKGVAAAAASKDDEARDAFRQAIQADPKLDAAHQRLCELCERQGDENPTLAAYRAWAAAGPRTPLPYNKIGEILERRKDDKGALDAYAKSLEIEWNQPPIIEAKSRLMLRLKQ
jgi:Tfp pilus assembly protein PilF